MSWERFVEDYGDVQLVVHRGYEVDGWEYCINKLTTAWDGSEAWQTFHKGLNSYENGAIALKLGREFLAQYIAPYHKE